MKYGYYKLKNAEFEVTFFKRNFNKVLPVT